MSDPKSMTLHELMHHYDRTVRAKAYDLCREVSMVQLEENQRTIVVSQEPCQKGIIRESFRPLT